MIGKISLVKRSLGDCAVMLCTVQGLFVLGWLSIAEKSKPTKGRDGDLYQILALFPMCVRGGKLLQNYRLAIFLGTRIVLPLYGVRKVWLFPTSC